MTSISTTGTSAALSGACAACSRCTALPIPGSACVNAERCFAITRKEQNIISSHMWPLTFRHVPTCREAVIVCLADKYCAVLESVFQRTRVADTDAADNEW